jgi:hypothetical protein
MLLLSRNEDLRFHASVDERLANHEDHEGHEGRIKKITSKPKKYFLLRALRGAISFSPLGMVLPR